MKIDFKLAEHYFNEAKKLFDKDDGSLWGINFNGPIMFVHPETRDIVANQQDTEKDLKKEGNLYVGKLPKNMNPANSTMIWNGIKWVTILWYAIENNEKEMLKTIAHESFHRIQDQLKFHCKRLETLSHLQTTEGRIWFKLEREALIKALENDANEKYIFDALLFKEYRRSLFENSGDYEDRSELHESLAVYTEHKLTNPDIKNTIAYIIEANKRNVELKSLDRAYPYLVGALYGFLLDRLKIEWVNKIDQDFSFNKILKEYLNYKTPENLRSSAINKAELYGYKEIIEFEIEREKITQGVIDKYLKKINDKPLFIEAGDASLMFKARMILKIANDGRLIDCIRSVGSWGILEVTDGVLLNSESNEYTVSMPKTINGKDVEGDGWKLELNSGYGIIFNANRNRYEIKKQD